MLLLVWLSVWSILLHFSSFPCFLPIPAIPLNRPGRIAISETRLLIGEGGLKKYDQPIILVVK